jgi:hypothetical protein
MGRKEGAVSRATEWREKARQAAQAAAVELELPSGMKILARRPDPLQLATWGRLPLSLAGPANGAGAERVTAEDVVEMGGFFRNLLEHCCVEPRVSLAPGPEEIHPREIPQEDWMFLVRWAMRAEEARALESFRGERRDAGAGGDGGAVRGEAVGAAGDRGSRTVVEC